MIPQNPWTWRIDPSGGPGVIADLGSHIIGMARFLLGDIAEVSADVRTVIKQRPVARGASEMKPVEVDDVARILVNFGRGCGGTIEANWIQTGRKMQLGFELTGEKGSLVFTQERLNELQLLQGRKRRAPQRLHPHRSRPAARALWRLLHCRRASAWVQRPEDHRDG